MQTPEFWHIDCAAARCFTPISWVYQAVGKLRRNMAKPYDPGIPVICVGNVVAGGAGKTPICLSIADYVKSRGVSPVFLGYGYGGLYGGPLVVDPHQHQAIHVGDEALLLTRSAVTIIGEDRASAARLAASESADLLIMDDGFQNPYVKKSLSLLVVDGEYGLGNGRVIPAGPLREKFDDAVARADAVVLYGVDKHDLFSRVSPEKQILRARLAPDQMQIEKLRNKKLIAFAGIGRPQKFFDMLTNLGLNVVSCHAFPDHHYFSSAEIVLLQQKAAEAGAALVTTAKDLVRLEWPLREGIIPIHVSVQWADVEQFHDLVGRILR